ncbi:MAG: HD domain-containing protein [Paraclostridium sp.]
MRNQAEEILFKYLETDRMRKHCYAVEAVMRSLAQRLEPEAEEKWAISGLLHDLDSDIVGRKPGEVCEGHAITTVELLKKENFGDEEIYRTILGHHDGTGITRESLMEKAIYAADPITGFITAIALVYPDKKLTSVKTKSIVKRMKETRFASNVNRDAIRSIENIGISFEDFAQLSLDAMKNINDILE